MIQVRELSKYYGGKRALGPVSFEIEDGETVGFLGLNGAGKTTALRILACDLRPSAGAVKIDSVDALTDPHTVRRQVGFLPENPPLYTDMTVRDYLVFAGRLRGMVPFAVQKRLPEVAQLTHLDGVLDDPIRSLSHGFRQRVGVAQAIVHEPKLLILDEPTRGLDPVQIVEMRALIRALKRKHTVLISSHILPEISETCDRLLVLGGGEIVGAGTETELSKELTSARRVVVAVRTEATADDVTACLRGVTGVTGVTSAPAELGETDAHAFEVTAESDVRAAICQALVAKGHGVIRLDRAQHKLENIFLTLVQGQASAKQQAQAKTEDAGARS